MKADRSSEKNSAVKEWPHQVIGGKYVRILQTCLPRLREEEPHGNRQLFLDDVFVVHLLSFFNPVVGTLQTMEGFSQAPQVQKHLSIRRICKSTLLDVHQLVDPQRLEPVLQQLRRQLSRQQWNQPAAGGGTGIENLLKSTVAVDGTFLPAVAEVAWSVANSNHHGVIRHRARLDVHLNVSNWIPEAIVVPESRQSEADSAMTRIEPGKIDLDDRGYMSFPLLAGHYAQSSVGPAVKSSFVVRYREAGGNSPELQVTKENRLTKQDLATGVVSDRIGRFVSSNSSRHPLPEIVLREICVHYETDGVTKPLRLITNLLSVSAATVALLYRQRWQVELFFRWLKTVANFNYLISQCREGMLLHLYVTIIATLEEVLPILRERERQCALARASDQRRRVKKPDPLPQAQSIWIAT